MRRHRFNSYAKYKKEGGRNPNCYPTADKSASEYNLCRQQVIINHAPGFQ